MQGSSPRNSPPGKETQDAPHETGGLPRRAAMANYAAAMHAVLSGTAMLPESQSIAGFVMP